ncbi:MAG TPA: AMP-binding protein [Burkholderiaceae bacterium]|mgnify:CR=1 FL=1|nr:AMP-binding protein [Burkholderiaceae bacterium]
MKTPPSQALPHDHYDALHSQFAWHVPEHFNIAQVCCTRWAIQTPHAVAIREHIAGASRKSAKTYTFSQLQHAANAMSAQLRQAGVKRGERVAIVLPQRFETAVAYIAVLQLGAVAVPLSMLFGPDALEYRINDSDAVLAIVDESSEPVLRGIQVHCPKLMTIMPVSSIMIAYVAIKNIAYKQKQTFEVHTKADEGAILIYTSGTTGPPKGALIPHRALIGNLTGFVSSQNWFGFDGISNKTSHAVFWSPADWAWTGGLMDALLPTLYFGREIVAYRGRFSPEVAYELMQMHGVTHTFLFPTALKAMMKAFPQPKSQFKLKIQAIMSAGEAVGDAVYDYCQKQLGVTVNEMFGQTEINYIVGNCNRFWPSKPNSMGKPYPGHQVAVIDDDGNICPDGVPGDVAVNRFDIHGVPDPIFFLGYWKNDAATQAKFTGNNGQDNWCRTGDLATRDADGYLWYQGRADDVFKAAGYRIGPSEIENCLVKHPAVANAAVVPKPDAERGAVVKAYVVLAAGFEANDALVEQLQAHVKSLLAPYEYPKEIEFIDALPMTTTGKVQRRVLRLQEEERAKHRKI